MLSKLKKVVPSHLKESLRKTIYSFVKPPGENSYSQSGEDRVLSYLFKTMGIINPTYLDIGANDPIVCNNTYLFYEKGSSGVCIEPDPAIFDELSKVRTNDKCLNVAITFDDRKEADFYIFSSSTLNTLSKEEAVFREKTGSCKIEKVIKIPLKNINEIIKEYFDKAPDLISLDAEGIDLEILKSLDFDKYRPIAICVETVTYSENRTEEKITEIMDFVTTKGYTVYADTHINTIFVNKKRFKKDN